jgi:RimJ/RimL family protein N-acetyltransferase
VEQIADSAVPWTPRLLLRQPITDDVGVILRLHQEPLAIAHNPGDAVQDEIAAQQLLERWTRHWEQYAIGYWALCWRGDPTVLGFCGVKVMALHGRTVTNLLYRLDPRVWGRGIATEAASAVVKHALRQRPGDPVIARVRPANEASARVALKAGLTRAPELDTPGADGLDHIFASALWTIT